jgi:hypothetical protein
MIYFTVFVSCVYRVSQASVVNTELRVSTLEFYRLVPDQINSFSLDLRVEPFVDLDIFLHGFGPAQRIASR